MNQSSINHDQILINATREHAREGRTQHAQILVGAWMQREPQAAAPHALQALLDMLSGQIDSARTHAQQSVTIDRHCAIGYFALAQVYLAEKQTEEGRMALQRAQSLAPDDGEVACQLSYLMLEAGEHEQAATLLRTALKSGRSAADVQARLMLAEVLLNHFPSDLDDAEQLVREVCNTAPHRASAWALHGMTLATMGDAVGARERLELALALEPDQPAFLIPLAQLLCNTTADAKSLELAANHARRATVLAPQDWRGSMLLAQILRRQRQPAAAMKVLANAGKTWPAQAPLLLETALTCAELGQFSAAREALSRAAALPGMGMAAHGVRVEVAMREGKVLEACTAFDEMDATSRSSSERLPVPLQAENMRGMSLGLIAHSIPQCLLFVRYAATLANLGVNVRLAAPANWAPLLARVPGVTDVSTDAKLSAHWLEPVLRLPLLLGLGEGEPLFNGPYLSPDPAALVTVQARRTEHVGQCMLIDLGADPQPILVRKLTEFLVRSKVLAVVSREWAPALQQQSVQCLPWDLDDIDQLSAWAVTADSVLCGDVPLAHLAGGMGLHADVLLPIGHDSVWGGQGGKTPWYPTLRLHRASLDGGWEDAWNSLEPVLDASNAEAAMG